MVGNAKGLSDLWEDLQREKPVCEADPGKCGGCDPISKDEVTWDLIENEQGEFYDAFAQRVNLYLRKKAVEIVGAGANVILDWGFWTRENRCDISAFLTAQKTAYEWHYIDIDDDCWRRHIAKRNAGIEQGNRGPDFYVDEGLLKKLESLFEPPEKNEMDVIYTPEG